MRLCPPGLHALARTTWTVACRAGIAMKTPSLSSPLSFSLVTEGDVRTLPALCGGNIISGGTRATPHSMLHFFCLGHHDHVRDFHLLGSFSLSFCHFDTCHLNILSDNACAVTRLRVYICVNTVE